MMNYISNEVDWLIGV